MDVNNKGFNSQDLSWSNNEEISKDFQSSNKIYFLKLINNSNSCYANSLIQAFLALDIRFFEKVNNFFIINIYKINK